MNDAPTLPALQETPVRTPCEVAHTLYQCPLYIWSASAHGRHWLYVEYRDQTGAGRYAAFHFAQADALRHFVLASLPTESLAGISPEQTRKRPISVSAERART